jgi:ring-1,2-phenylacetyl-CoA epoxidase subunit PaaD
MSVVAESDLRAVLCGILDPEMPINIVDLGIVHALRIEPQQSPEPNRADAPNDGAPLRRTSAHAGPAAGGHVVVEITPTFVGCPALDVLRREIDERLRAVAGVSTVEVRFVNHPPWTVQRISPAGREALRRHGVTVPAGPSAPRPGVDEQAASALGAVVGIPVPLTTSVGPRGVPGGARGAARDRVACPFCGSASTRCESTFGPTRCRMIYYCEACRNTFEHLKDV